MKPETEVALRHEAFQVTSNLIRLTWSEKPQKLPTLVWFVTRRVIDWVILGVLAALGTLLIPHNDKAAWATPLVWGVAGLAGLIWIATFCQAIYWTRRARRFIARLQAEYSS